MSALWGKRTGSRGRGLVVLLALALLLGMAAPADAASGKRDAFVPADLLEAAEAQPNRSFRVIVQAIGGKDTADAARAVADARRDAPGAAAGLKRKFTSVPGVAAEVTGRQLVRLAGRSSVLSITPDARMIPSVYSSTELWTNVAGMNGFWNPAGGQSIVSAHAPAIAIVDSGVDKTRPDLARNVRAEVTITSLPTNSPGDGRGHGTLVASIAAGAADGRAGAAAGAPIVSLDVLDDQGMGMTSDVIAAADWILANKAAHNIRVANFSLHSSVPSSFMFDPLDKAVERLWFSGVVVVAAAGNYGNPASPSGVPFAPANDPFVITVGAADIKDSNQPSDDAVTEWSAYGSTLDGFAKPEIGAPGRRIVAAVPLAATMPLEHPQRVVAPGYMWMSGTSFAAPIVAGAAANLLARHPSWTPDQVKGALMLTARPTTAKSRQLGVGEVHGASADKLTTTPPNPNLALNQFVVADPNGGTTPVFDAASWASHAQADASWASASWASASWASASWASASWASASWASASWASASWASQATEDASWASASWANASWASASWAAGTWVE